MPGGRTGLRRDRREEIDYNVILLRTLDGQPHLPIAWHTQVRTFHTEETVDIGVWLGTGTWVDPLAAPQIPRSDAQSVNESGWLVMGRPSISKASRRIRFRLPNRA